MTGIYSELDCLIIGEALIDLISDDFTDSLAAARGFQRFAGGQAANTASNLARLQNSTALAACVGNDGFGKFISQSIIQAGVHPEFIQVSSEAATTISVITRHTQTPDFLICRGADGFLNPDQALFEQAAHCRFIHTSAFALSRDPSRSSILAVLQQGKANQALISIDPNYHPSIWPDIQNYTEILAQAIQFADFVKPSADDCARLLGPDMELKECADKFIEWGAHHVLLTMGTDGTMLYSRDGSQVFIHPLKIDVVDVTGAGDGFWAWFITAILDGKNVIDGARMGQTLAELKISTLGPLENIPDRQLLYGHAKKTVTPRVTIRTLNRDMERNNLSKLLGRKERTKQKEY